MRCRACNCSLTDFESTRRSAVSRDFLDMCNRCLAPVVADITTTENFELFDPELDDLSSVPTPPPEPGDIGAGPDADEEEE